MDWRLHIAQDPAVMCGKPVIKGTRITVAHILELLGNGWPASDILASCPGLVLEDIQAAQSYAAAYLELDETVFLHTGTA